MSAPPSDVYLGVGVEVVQSVELVGVLMEDAGRPYLVGIGDAESRLHPLGLAPGAYVHQREVGDRGVHVYEQGLAAHSGFPL